MILIRHAHQATVLINSVDPVSAVHLPSIISSYTGEQISTVSLSSAVMINSVHLYSTVDLYSAGSYYTVDVYGYNNP